MNFCEFFIYSIDLYFTASNGNINNQIFGWDLLLIF